LNESTMELSHKVDQVQPFVSPIIEIVPQLEKIPDNTKKPEEIEPDWSQKVSWKEVADRSGSTTKHKIVLLEHSPLFITDKKNPDKGSVSMAKLLPEEAE
ncbi:hypothetical protein KI387_005170, partial [Taxus chinensis]